MYVFLLLFVSLLNIACNRDLAGVGTLQTNIENPEMKQKILDYANKNKTFNNFLGVASLDFNNIVLIENKGTTKWYELPYTTKYQEEFTENIIGLNGRVITEDMRRALDMYPTTLKPMHKRIVVLVQADTISDITRCNVYKYFSTDKYDAASYSDIVGANSRNVKSKFTGTFQLFDISSKKKMHTISYQGGIYQPFTEISLSEYEKGSIEAQKALKRLYDDTTRKSALIPTVRIKDSASWQEGQKSICGHFEYGQYTRCYRGSYCDDMSCDEVSCTQPVAGYYDVHFEVVSFRYWVIEPCNDDNSDDGGG